MLNQVTDDPSAEAPTTTYGPEDVGSKTPAKAPTLPVVEQAKISSSLVFRVDSVKKTATPGGGQGHDWYRYVLKNHRSTINGLRRGSHQHVCDYAAQYAEQLNTRILSGSRNWSMRSNKAARTL